MHNLHFSLCKMLPNYLNFGDSNTLFKTIQIDSSFPMLYFNPLIQIQMKCINKLVDFNWLNRATLKPVLNKVIKCVLYTKYPFKKYKQAYKPVNNIKIILISKSCCSHLYCSFPNIKAKLEIET